jgi:hypothetical protein
MWWPITFFFAFHVEVWAVADGDDSRAMHCPYYDSTRAMHYYSVLREMVNKYNRHSSEGRWGGGRDERDERRTRRE